MYIPHRNSPGDIGTTLTQTPSEAGLLQQQNVLQKTTEQGCSTDHSIPTLPKASPTLAWDLIHKGLWAPSPKLRADNGCHQVK